MRVPCLYHKEFRCHMNSVFIQGQIFWGKSSAQRAYLATYIGRASGDMLS